MVSWREGMARIDRIKEEIGWLKLLFGILAAVDVSILGWLAQAHATASKPVLIAGAGAALLVTAGIIWVNVLAHRLIAALEDT
jgi:hypothetical protein